MSFSVKHSCLTVSPFCVLPLFLALCLFSDSAVHFWLADSLTQLSVSLATLTLSAVPSLPCLQAVSVVSTIQTLGLFPHKDNHTFPLGFML